ncbi:MAG: lactate racemase domain-containing protein [Chloroflexi bacterium]|nr:lactate racemase domain-containing protein [Chloroflexota bacterium]
MNEGIFTQDFLLPDTWQVERISAPVATPIADLHAAVREALHHPIAALPIAELIGPGTRICIATDGTGPAHFAVLNAVLDAAFEAGASSDDIVVLSTPPGYDPQELPVAQVLHDATDLRAVNELGRYEGVPLSVNHYAAEADLLIGLGTLHLDDLLRDSGSQRLVGYEFGGSVTQRELDDTRFLDDRISPYRAGEPLFDRVVREGARRAGLVFIVDLLLDEGGRAVAIKAGAPQKVNAELCLIAHTLREADASHAADLLVADVGPVDLYSAARAPIHIGLAPDTALVRGGVVVLPKLCAESSAEPAEVDAFYDALDLGASSDEVIQHLRGRALGPGESRAYLLAHVMQHHPIIAISTPGARTVRHIIAVNDMTEATELAETMLGRRPHMLLLSRALSSLPVASRFTHDKSTDDMLSDLLDDMELE